MHLFYIFILCLFAFLACKKRVVEIVHPLPPVVQGDTSVINHPTIIPEEIPAEENPAKIFKIITQLAVRAGLCEDGNCGGISLDIKESGQAGFVEGILLEGLTIKDNSLIISKTLQGLLNDEFMFSILQSFKAIIAIQFVLTPDKPTDKIESPHFNIVLKGVEVPMELGFYKEITGAKRLRIEGFSKFVRSSSISKTMGPARENKYALLLLLSLGEVKDIYNKVQSGTKVRFQITASAKNYDKKDVKTLKVVLES